MATFPQVRSSPEAQSRLLDHKENLEHMLKTYGIDYRYNLITKRMEWTHPDIPDEGDNAETRLFSHLIGLAAMNEMPAKNLDTHLTALGDEKGYNPVTDYLSELTWDGTLRICKMASELNASDPEVAQIALKRFLIQACAAADHAAIAASLGDHVEAHFEYVLVIVGDQGKRKTKGLRRILPQPLRKLYREGQVLTLSNKDSVKRVVSNWIVELGEIDATFQKSEISQKKAFLSQSEDEIRAPYARKDSRYGRRTVFVGTVNEKSFLADETGNRRYLPITVDRLSVDWSDEELDQLWAEAWHLYATGEQWWPTEDEEAILAVNADKYRIRTAIEERIETEFAWGQPPAQMGKRATATEIYHDVMPHNAPSPDAKALKTVGACLKRLWSASGLVESHGGELALQNSAGALVNVNSSSGRNRGWLLPPKSSGERSEAARKVLKAVSKSSVSA